MSMRYLFAITLLVLVAVPARAEYSGEGTLHNDIEESIAVATSADPYHRVGDWEGFVTKVIDADTIEIDGERMRLLGVNAPEYEGANNDCYALESARQLEKLVLGKLVTYSFDRGYGRRDDHGDHRIYLYYEGMLINAWLIENGFAFVDLSKHYAVREELMPLQVDARRHHLGFWHTCPVECEHDVCRTKNW